MKTITKILATSLALIGALAHAQPTKSIEDRIRGRFIVSGIPAYYQHSYGGYVLFQKQMGEDSCAKKSPDSLIFIDHEGGAVNRIGSALPSPAKGLKNPQSYYKQWQADAATLKSICADAVLGPTVDPELDGRSLSKSISQNFEVAQNITKALEKGGALATWKHFPGQLGRCWAPDPSREVRICQQDLNEIREAWLLLKIYQPKALMVSNYQYKTREGKPAFSDPEILSLLRNEFGYQGLVITDTIWEMTRQPTLTELETMWMNVDMIMHLEVRQVESLIPFFKRKVERDPKFSEALIRSEQRINNYRREIR